MAKSSSSRIVQLARTRIDVDCYLRWLRLKSDPEYLRESEKIRQLNDAVCKAEQHAKDTYSLHKNVLKRSRLSSNEAYKAAQEECQKTEEFARVAGKACEEEEKRICEKFGISQWWPPEDNNLGMENARYIFEPLPSIQIIPPPPDMEIDLNAEGIKRMWQDLLHAKSVVEPPQKYTMADKNGWLTIKINLQAPLNELEEAIRRELRRHRYFQPSGRNRPDKDAAALEVWDGYVHEKRFSVVAKKLGRKVSTVKGQYVKAHILIHGQRPSGSIKQRRAGKMRDPQGEFSAHYGSCSRCQKADSADKLCSKFLAYIDQDTKADLDRRATRNLGNEETVRYQRTDETDEIM